MISNLNGSGSVQVRQKKSGFYRFTVQVRFDSLARSLQLLHFRVVNRSFLQWIYSRKKPYYVLVCLKNAKCDGRAAIALKNVLLVILLSFLKKETQT